MGIRTKRVIRIVLKKVIVIGIIIGVIRVRGGGIIIGGVGELDSAQTQILAYINLS